MIGTRLLTTLSTCVGLLVATLAITQSTADERELARLEAVWNDAHRSGDADVLAALWADDLVVTVPAMPAMGREELLAFVRSGRMRFSRYETSEVRIRTYGEAAVVSGRLRRTRTLGGVEVDDDWRFTKVYVRRDGVWQVVAWHASERPAG
jgi:uncharacterized protein (TIGR02246 family)